MKAIATLAMVLLAGSALAKSPVFEGKEIKPLPPKPYPVNVVTVEEHGPLVQRVLVTVQMGKGNENPVWHMTHTASQVWLGKLSEPEPVAPVDQAVLKQVKSPSPSYKGLKIEMQTVNGKKFEPITVYNGKVVGPKGQTVKDDPGRGLEYWVFSTARVRRDLLLGPQVLPVIAFEQCRLLGMEIVATEPRQCLLPDKTILLQTDEKPTRASLKAKDFDSCLKHGQALIASFPRRCMAAGGRVFAEPPRVAEAPADAPLVAGVSGTLEVPASPTALVSPVEVVNPLLGTYTLSGTVPVTSTLPLVSETMVPMTPSETLGAILGGSVTVVSSSEVVSGSWIAPEVNPGAGPESWREWAARNMEDLRLYLKAKGF
jgi:hypothetical protein